GFVGHEVAADVEHPEAVVAVAEVAGAEPLLVGAEDVVDERRFRDDVDHGPGRYFIMRYSASEMRKLTPTSYAILGLLALRPWSAYELTKQVRRSLHFCWPRAETRLYQEPKNLVEHGLVKATTTVNGRRPRTEYAITAKGRKA